MSPLDHLTTICLALPETAPEPFGDHTRFLVRKKSFAWYLNNHHDDGILAVACKMLPGENSELARLDPTRYYVPPYLGANGWVGIRLDIEDVDWDEIADYITASYRLLAPKRLAAQVKNST